MSRVAPQTAAGPASSGGATQVHRGVALSGSGLVSGSLGLVCSSRGCAGLSLVELLVSVMLGLLLSAGIVRVYLDSKSSYLIEEEMARIQENGRFALHLLQRELALAGFFGGGWSIADFTPLSSVPDCGSAADWPLTPTTPVDLLNDYVDGAVQMASGVILDCVDGSELQAGSDVLALKRSAAEATLRDGVYQPGLSGAATGQWYLRLVDYGADVSWWRAGIIPAAEVNPVGGTGVDYWESYANIYFVRNYSVDPGDRIPSLCAERLSASAMRTQCLIEGVESLQIEFGIDSNGDGVPNQYMTAPAPADLARAISARVYLLLRSLTPVAPTNSKDYQLGQTAIAAKNDAYLRRVFSTTVQLRNAAPGVL